jgi:DNA ligase (NAD+)
VLINDTTTHYEWISRLHHLGFFTPFNEIKISNNTADINHEIAKWDTYRDDFPIEIDGMVIKVNSPQLQLKIGSTSHHPRWAAAYKFKPKQAATRLLAIEYQVGRTGAITPVAKLQPVALAGVVVSSVSLHNAEYIAEKDIRIGDMVYVERAGDVIPYISGSNANVRTGAEVVIVFPSHCPACHSPLNKTEDEAIWRCTNDDCSEVLIGKIIHFASKDAMDISGLGAKIVERFCSLGFIKTIVDIYQLPFHEIEALEGFGNKSREKLQLAIEASKTKTLSKLINALGIRFVGENTAKNLAKEVESITDYFDKSLDDLMHIQDVGDKVARSIFDYFQNKTNQSMLLQLQALGVNMLSSLGVTVIKVNIFENKTFLFTGTLSTSTRAEAEKKVEQYGGKIVSGVSAKLNYLIVGTDAGSKLEKAKKIASIQVLTELEFHELFKE